MSRYITTSFSFVSVNGTVVLRCDYVEQDCVLAAKKHFSWKLLVLKDSWENEIPSWTISFQPSASLTHTCTSACPGYQHYQ